MFVLLSKKKFFAFVYEIQQNPYKHPRRIILVCTSVTLLKEPMHQKNQRGRTVRKRQREHNDEKVCSSA